VSNPPVETVAPRCRARIAGLRRYPRLSPVQFRRRILSVTVGDVTGPSRAGPVVRIRHEVAHLLWLQGMSVGEVAVLLHRNHSTISYAISRTYRRGVALA